MLSQELQDIFKGKKRKKIIETLEFIHTESNTNIFLCKNSNNLNLYIEDSTQKEFEKSNFIVKLPKYSEDQNLSITISFSSVSFKYRQILENIIRTYETKIEVKYRLYSENNYKFPAIQAPFKFSINEINMQKRNITLGGSLLLSVQKKIPSLKMDSYILKGLKYDQ